MPPGLRKLVLTVHLTGSVGWIGAGVAYLALGVAAATGGDAGTVRAAWIAMDLIGRWTLAPLALAALLTGVALSLGTPWGLFRHYWVAISLGLTVFAAAILLLHLPDVGATADVARAADDAGLSRLGGDLPHAGGGLVVLLVITVLNVYKPRGLTPYGWRKQREERARRMPCAPAVRSEAGLTGRAEGRSGAPRGG
jgi:hypothetical protein